ncbi:hypothetical protein VNO77_17132 [Canavalia gladiata]|uniref:Uncharacterized protein n=1 Tax=Canavalia gladiata TaxID=3824 RepID=A0AAN9LIM7_CANGL
MNHHSISYILIDELEQLADGNGCVKQSRLDLEAQVQAINIKRRQKGLTVGRVAARFVRVGIVKRNRKRNVAFVPFLNEAV